MLNVIELENRWRKYKLKSYIPYISITFIILVIGLIFILFIQPQKKKIIQKKDEKKITKIQTVKKINNVKEQPTKVLKKIPVIQKQKREKQKEDTKLILSPSLNFIDNIKYDYKEVKRYKKPVLKKQTLKKEIKKEQKEQELKKKITVVEKKIEKKTIHIEKQSTQKDIDEVLSRFKKNNNPALSLFIAKKYYELKDYSQSYNYALITNGINDEIEASWIIFSKSLVKLGKKDKAIQTLKSYVEHTNSNQAKILLEEIISGKFR